jgi:hypothetical protein
MGQKRINKLGVDCETHDKKELIGRLGKLKTTVTVEDGGMYHQDKEYSQIWIDTTMTEEELDCWLFETKFKDAIPIGVFVRKG